MVINTCLSFSHKFPFNVCSYISSMLNQHLWKSTLAEKKERFFNSYFHSNLGAQLCTKLSEFKYLCTAVPANDIYNNAGRNSAFIAQNHMNWLVGIKCLDRRIKYNIITINVNLGFQTILCCLIWQLSTVTKISRA